MNDEINVRTKKKSFISEQINRYIPNLKYDCSVSQCPLVQWCAASLKGEQRVSGGGSQAQSHQGKMSFY